MAGHPSVKKRQKELQRKERQAEKLARRDERRTRPQVAATEESFDELALSGVAPSPGDGTSGAGEANPGAPSGEEPRRP